MMNARVDHKWGKDPFQTFAKKTNKKNDTSFVSKNIKVVKKPMS